MAVLTSNTGFAGAGEKVGLLRQNYEIDAEPELVSALDRDASLFPLLREAVGPLSRAFAQNHGFRIRAEEWDGYSYIKIAVQLPPEAIAAADRSLAQFDAGWWVQNCHRAGRTLIFDYEIENGL